MISSVAESYQIHPQTLRLYERLGLLMPSRSDGNTRLYTDEDLQRLEIILTLTRELGVNLAGVEVFLNMRHRMEEMRRQMENAIRALREQLKNEIDSANMDNKETLVPVGKMGLRRRVKDA